MTATPLPTVTEKAFMQAVIDYALLMGWLPYHTHDSRHSQPGFPDLVLVREHVLFVELKRDNGRLTAAQEGWAGALRYAGAEWRCWRPSDWPAIETELGRKVQP